MPRCKCAIHFTTTDTIDDAVLTRAIEALRNAFKEQHEVQFLPGWKKQTAMGTAVDMPVFQHRCALHMPEGAEEEEYEICTDDMRWPQPPPIALLPYCDNCCRPFTVTRDEAARATVLTCRTCGERQRIGDWDAECRLSEADRKKLQEMRERSQG